MNEKAERDLGVIEIMLPSAQIEDCTCEECDTFRKGHGEEWVEEIRSLRSKLAGTEEARQYAETERDKLAGAVEDLLERHYDERHDHDLTGSLRDRPGAMCECFPYANHAALLMEVAPCS